MTAAADAILTFWFDELGPEKWFATSPEIDAAIHSRFHSDYVDAMAADANLAPWLATPGTSLALVILLDQFPRNMFRATDRAFEADGRALKATREAISRGHDLETQLARRVFFYMPFEHSERLEDQEEAVRLVRERADISDYLAYAEIHRDIIRRFGRFPHRNALLGRASTPEETTYLAGDVPTFGTASQTAQKEN